jgi:hypothetical protein
MEDYSRRMVPVIERVERSESRAPRRLAITATAVQLWLVTAYFAVAVVPYFWRDGVMANAMDDPVGKWLLAVPALLLGPVGFWVSVFDAAVATALVVGGVLILSVCGRRLSKRMVAWLLATTLLSLAFLLFSMTPPAEDIRVWVLD